MPRRKDARAVRGRRDDTGADEGREDLDWGPGRLKTALDGIWEAAAALLESGSKERP